MLPSNDKFSVHVSSKSTLENPYNHPGKFVTRFTTPLQLQYGKWKMALSQALLPRRMKILPTLNLKFLIEDFDTNLEHEITFPDIVKDCEDLVLHFTKYISIVAKVEEWPTKNLSLIFKEDKKCRVTLGHDLAFILGFLETDPNIKQIKILHNMPDNHEDQLAMAENNEEQLVSAEETLELEEDKDSSDEKNSHIVEVRTNNDTFLFHNAPQMVQLHPASIFIYCKEVEFTICGSQKLPLLSIIETEQHSTNRDDGYIDREIKEKNFVSLTNTILHSLEFQLSSYDNSMIQFEDDDARVFFTLIFQRMD